MFESVAQGILSINVLGTGFIIPAEALIFAIALLLGNEKIEATMLMFAIINMICGLGIFIGVQESGYMMLIGIITMIWIAMPSNTINNFFGKRQ